MKKTKIIVKNHYGTKNVKETLAELINRTNREIKQNAIA